MQFFRSIDGRFWRPFRQMFVVVLCFVYSCALIISCGVPRQSVESEEVVGSEPAMAGAAIAIARILAQGGLAVSKKVIQKAFTEKAAHQAIRILRSHLENPTANIQGFQRLKTTLCFSLHLANDFRVVLAADKITVLFAGSHEAYNNLLRNQHFSKLCRGK